MSSKGKDPGDRGGPPGESAESVWRTIAGDENLIVKEDKSRLLSADDRGEECGGVGLVGVDGRDDVSS